MSEQLVLRDLVDALRSAGIVVGIDDHLALARLVERYDGTSATELRDAIAALLAASPEQVIAIRRAFERLYLEPEPPTDDRKPRRWWIGAAIALLSLGAVIGIALWLRSAAEPRPVAPPPVEPPPLTEPAGQAETCTPPRPNASGEMRRVALPAYVGLALAAASLFELLWTLRRRRARWARRVRSHRLDRLPGPRTYVLPPAQTWSRAFLDDLAATLGAPSDSRSLDVPRTVERMVRAGMAPVLVYRQRRRRLALALAVHGGPDLEPFHEAVDELAAGLVRRGVPVERLRPGVRPTREDAALMIVATSAWRPHDKPRWLVDRAARGLVAVIRPLGQDRDSEWPVFALDEQSLHAAARYLSGATAEPVVAPALQWTDVLQLRAMLALAPRSSFAMAERLRGRFLPHAPRSILAAVREANLPDPTRARLWLAEIEPGVEPQLRRFFLDTLQSVEPLPGSAGHLRWRRDRVEQLAALPADAHEARLERASLAETPVDLEATSPHDFVPMPGDPPAPPWLPDVAVPFAVLALAAAALVIPVATEQLSPQYDSTFYRLTYDAVAQRLNAERADGRSLRETASTVGILDNGKPVGTISDLDGDGQPEYTGALAPPINGTHCFQAWTEDPVSPYVRGSLPLAVNAIPPPALPPDTGPPDTAPPDAPEVALTPDARRAPPDAPRDAPPDVPSAPPDVAAPPDVPSAPPDVAAPPDVPSAPPDVAASSNPQGPPPDAPASLLPEVRPLDDLQGPPRLPSPSRPSPQAITLFQDKYAAPFCSLGSNQQILQCNYATNEACAFNAAPPQTCDRRPSTIFCQPPKSDDIATVYAARCFLADKACGAGCISVDVPAWPNNLPGSPEPADEELAQEAIKNRDAFCLYHLPERSLVFCNFQTIDACTQYRRRLAGGTSHECKARPASLFCSPGTLVTKTARLLTCYPDLTACLKHSMPKQGCRKLDL